MKSVFILLGAVLGCMGCTPATVDPWSSHMQAATRAQPSAQAAARALRAENVHQVAEVPLRARRTQTDAITETRVDQLPGRAASDVVLDHATLKRAMDQGPQRFMSKVMLDPFFVDRRFVGFRLTRFYEGDPRFSEIDLRRGDVVLRVNGLPIGRPNQFMQAWNEVKHAREIRIDYLRGAEKRVLRVRVLGGEERGDSASAPDGSGAVDE